MLSELPWLYIAAGLPLGWSVLWLYLRRWRDMQVIRVLDGDTYEATDRRGVTRRLRLWAVDCPEHKQRNAEEAKLYVKHRAHKKWVRVRLRGRDRYRRHVAEVRVEGRCLSYLLVKEGLAYPLTSHWHLRVATAGARLAGKGVHAGGGQPKPWQSFSRSWMGRLWSGSRKRR